VSYNYNYVDYAPNNQTVTIPKDAGYHNQINVSFNVSHNAGGGASMAGVFGSIFGFGNSGKDLEIKNLSYVKLGYSASLDYSNGGSYTGADFAVSKLSVKLLGSLELKTRHRLYAVVKGGQMFEGGFSDSVSSAGLLTGKGKYHAVYLGEKGAGAGFYASLSLMKNKTAVLVFEPFVETSWTYDENTEYRQSGTGASLYVTFWRFRLPIGVNYTHNINDKDYLVSFVAGAGF
jgi:hypothetical protein